MKNKSVKGYRKKRGLIGVRASGEPMGSMMKHIIQQLPDRQVLPVLLFSLVHHIQTRPSVVVLINITVNLPSSHHEGYNAHNACAHLATSRSQRQHGFDQGTARLLEHEWLPPDTRCSESGDNKVVTRRGLYHA